MLQDGTVPGLDGVVRRDQVVPRRGAELGGEEGRGLEIKPSMTTGRRRARSADGPLDLRQFPIFECESGNAPKLAGVVCHQNQPCVESDSSDKQVVGADWGAARCQIRAYAAVDPGCAVVKGK